MEDEGSIQEGDIRRDVQKHYGKMAAEFKLESRTSCCGGESSSSIDVPIASIIYETEEVKSLPAEVTGLSAGCGDPITLASLQPGEIVLDLGSGGGIDCFLAAKQVGESGYVIGVDMTAEMIEKARANKAKMQMANVEFRLGEIEHLPVADQSVDVVISNCVINLSPNKVQVIREAYRVLKPGGRLAISDILTDGPLPQDIQEDMASWAGCLAGAMDFREFQAILEIAGFVDVEIHPFVLEKSHLDESMKQATCSCGPEGKEGGERKAYVMIDGDWKAFEIQGSLPAFSARISARKGKD